MRNESMIFGRFCLMTHSPSRHENQRMNFFIVLVILMLCMSFFSLNPQWLTWLMWDREAIDAGQWWRLLSAHVMHLDNRHLLFNMIGLLLIIDTLCQAMSARELASLLLMCALGVGGLLLHRQSSLQWYVGLSGVLYGLWVAGSLQTWASGRKGVALAAGVTCVVKLIFFNDAITVMPVVSIAHMYGAESGLVWACLWRVSERKVIFD